MTAIRSEMKSKPTKTSRVKGGGMAQTKRNTYDANANLKRDIDRGLAHFWSTRTRPIEFSRR